MQQRILDSIQTRPQYLENPFEFEALLRGQRVRGERSIRLITQEVFEEANPQALSGYGTQGQFQQGGPGVLTERRLLEVLDQRDKDREIKELRREVEALKKGGGSPSSELWEEREKRLAAERDLAIRDAVSAALSQAGQSRPGRSTIDLLDGIRGDMDRRAGEIKDVLSKRPGFQPDVTRSPEERRAKAAQIEKGLEKTEEILKAEDALILAARGMFRSD